MPYAYRVVVVCIRATYISPGVRSRPVRMKRRAASRGRGWRAWDNIMVSLVHLSRVTVRAHLSLSLSLSLSLPPPPSPLPLFLSLFLSCFANLSSLHSRGSLFQIYSPLETCTLEQRTTRCCTMMTFILVVWKYAIWTLSIYVHTKNNLYENQRILILTIWINSWNIWKISG